MQPTTSFRGRGDRYRQHVGGTARLGGSTVGVGDHCPNSAKRLAFASEYGGSPNDRTYFRALDRRERRLPEHPSRGADRRIQVTPSYSTSRHCTVTADRWHSDYDGTTWTDPADFDIDHMVPSKEACKSGPRLWSSTTRTRYANDLGVSVALVAVTDNVNQSKGVQDSSVVATARGPASVAPTRSTGYR